MKTVIYARTKNPSSEVTLEVQVEMCRTYAKENGIDIVGTYCDTGAPSRDLKAREGMQRLLCDSAKGAFEAVIVANPDRLARNIGDYKDIWGALGKNGVRIIPVQGVAEREIDLLIDAMMAMPR